MTNGYHPPKPKSPKTAEKTPAKQQNHTEKTRSSSPSVVAGQSGPATADRKRM